MNKRSSQRRSDDGALLESEEIDACDANKDAPRLFVYYL